MKLRIWTVSLGVVCIFMLSASGCVPKLPPEGEPKVVLGEGVLTKSEWVKDARLDKVSAIAVFPEAEEGKRIAIAGKNGVLLCSAAAQAGEFISLSQPVDTIKFVRPTAAGFAGLVGHDPWSGGAAFDATGQRLFEISDGMGVNDVAAGDLDGDGGLDFVVGYNGWGGVSRLDEKGAMVWNVDGGGNIWALSCADADGKPGDEILHTNAAGEFVARDAKGGQLRASRPGSYCSSLSPCLWPGAKDKAHLIATHDDIARVFDVSGSVVATFAVPDSEPVIVVQGCAVTLRPGTAPGFAILIAHIKTSTLYVFDDKQQLLYQEVLPAAASGLAALPSGQAEALLVGSHGMVLRFAISGA
jgi:hypothetical protein